MERENDWKYEIYYDEYSKVLLLLNKPEEVIRICDKGLKVDPENAWLMVYKGSSYVMMGDSTAVNNSIMEIRSIVKKYNFSESTEAYALGTMYLSAKDTSMAEKYYRKAYVLDPENRNRKANLAGVLIRGNINIEEGLKMCEEVLAEYPGLTFWIHMKGLALYKLGRNQEALEILKEADKRTPGYNPEVSKEIMAVEKAIARQKNN
jgi:tetratricopeptide (TPR) repeat protein